MKKGLIYPSDFKFEIEPEYFDKMQEEKRNGKDILLIDSLALSENQLFISRTPRVDYNYELIGFENISESEKKLLEHFFRDFGGYLEIT